MNILRCFLPILFICLFYGNIARCATGCFAGNVLYTTTAALGYKGPGQTSTCGYTLAISNRFNCYVYNGNNFGFGEINGLNYSGPFQGGDYTAIVNCSLDEHVWMFIFFSILAGLKALKGTSRSKPDATPFAIFHY